MIGRAIGFIEYDWYFLDLLCIDEEYRNLGLGSKLVQSIEEYAKHKNLMGVRVETWDFQARYFYEKLGYEVYAELAECPPGTIVYFLRKYIK